MMQFKNWLPRLGVLPLLLAACVDHPLVPIQENPKTFKEIAAIDLGGEGAAEISAYDPTSKRLFTVNNESKALVDVIDLANLPTLTKLQSIDISALGGVANSVATFGGKLAIALEGTVKQDAGKVLVYDATTLTLLKSVTVGALPDMVTYSPDGNYLVTADEGEPNAAYTNDPDGSISIIDVRDNYSVKTVKFAGITGQIPTLTAGGFRLFGPSAGTPAKDIEPEYVTISPDSKKAWVTLQENNGIAEVDLGTGTLLRIFPLGTKDYSLTANAFDPTNINVNTSTTINFVNAPVKSFYLPDALAYFQIGGVGYLITADEGDAREYTGTPGYVEQARIGETSVVLDPTRFANAATLKQQANLGRLYITRSAGDTDGDGDFDELYAFGGRGFSIFNAGTGQRIYETGRTLEDRVVAAGRYDDSRSDDKGVEPEGVTVGLINGRTIAFVALERADAIAIYDVSTPTAPQFLQLLNTGDAPEGIQYVAPQHSPNGRSMLIVSSEGDGTVKIYQPDKL